MVGSNPPRLFSWESVAGPRSRVRPLNTPEAVGFASGALATVDLNFFEPAYRRACLVVGSHSVARWDWSQATITISRAGAEVKVIDVACDLADTYRAELVDFFEAVQEDGSPRASIREGVAAVRLARAVKRSGVEARRSGA